MREEDIISRELKSGVARHFTELLNIRYISRLSVDRRSTTKFCVACVRVRCGLAEKKLRARLQGELFYGSATSRKWALEVHLHKEEVDICGD